jgi:hypothetical protein
MIEHRRGHASSCVLSDLFRASSGARAAGHARLPARPDVPAVVAQLARLVPAR